jgi:amino acid adenylation domain-containing protein
MTVPLGFLAIPTAQRPVELGRAVSSFNAHLAASEQAVPIVVFHSARSAGEQAEVQAALRSAVSPGLPEVLYVGLGEKLALAKELRRATHVPPELLELALFNPRKQREAPGANRNAILLWGAGERLLSCDDDTTADLSAHPESTAGAALQPGILAVDPCDCLVPPDGVLEPFRLEPGDARWPEGGLAGALGRLWQAAESAGTPAPLAFLGLSGDCGWSAPFGFFGMPLGYLQLGPATLARLAATREGWKAVLASRVMLRVAPGPRLSRGAPGMTTALGIDAREELPPFVPVGRGEDLLFAAITERLRGLPSAHLPLAVAHRPPGVRRFSEGELWRAAGSLDLCRTFFALLETVPTGADLIALGQHLQAQAATRADFEGALRAGRRQLTKRLCAAARAYAEAQDGLPTWWHDDLLTYCDRTERAVAAEEPLWVLDSGPSDPDASVESARALVQGYGALCEAWPDLFRAARGRGAGLRESWASRPRPPQGVEASASSHGSEGSGAAAATATTPRGSPYQTWLWRLHRLDPGDNSYVILRRLRGRGAVRADYLEGALRAVAERHEALRCRLPPGPDDEPLLELRPAEELALDRLEPLGEAARGQAFRTFGLRPFDLLGGLPLRLTLAPATEEAGGSELWLAVHHVAFDGFAEDIFWRELDTAYANLLHARPAAEGLKPLAGGFRAVAQRQRRSLAASDQEALGQYWHAQLHGAPELRISWRTPGAPGSSTTLTRAFEVSPAVSRSLAERSRQLRTSLAAVGLAAWQALLSRWSGETDVVVAVPFANRLDELEEEQIALFMNALPVRARLAGDPSFEALAAGNRGRLAEAVANGRIPADRLARHVDSGRGRFGLFRVLFTHQVRRGAPRLSGVSLQPIAIEESAGATDLSLTLEESGDHLTAELTGNTSLFDAGDLERLGQALLACLAQLAEDPARRLSQISWLSTADAERLHRWNDTAADAPLDRPLPALLREQAERTPDAMALEAGREQLSYRELFRRADRVAERLRGHGVTRDDVVGLFIDRHPRMLEAMLGILVAGAGYLPLDPAFPRDRLAFMVQDAGASVLLTRKDLVERLPPHAAQVVCVDDDEAPPPRPPGWRGAEPDSLAYLLYTSGSTGKPKGVEVSHRALVNFLGSMARSPGLGPADVLLALTTLSFDISGLELWLPLLTGARIALAGREEATDGARLQRALAGSGATVLQATPTTWRALFASGWRGDARLKALVGGEALPPDLAQQLGDSCGEAWNLYGPTETTIWSTAWRIPKGAAPVRIGSPIANTQLHVLDEHGRPLPPGVAGELWIGGDGVARGYRGQPELTASRFVTDPFRPGGRLYRTGDVARWLPDGTVDFLGRSDDQLKVRGNRVEPGEIEAALHELPGVEQAAVGLRREGSDEGRLVAYLVATPGATLPSSPELRARLRDRLAEYLIPHHFVEVDRLPLTPNGKIDRKALAPLFRAPQEESRPDEPLDNLEAALVAEFTEVLGVPAGADTDFFEAGGDSLSALRLIGRVSRQETAIVGGDLFLHSTPRRLAARLREVKIGTAPPAPGRHLRLLREGTGAPIVFVHPIGGQILPYAPLARHLGTGGPVYGLQPSGQDSHYASLAERCAVYAEDLKALSPGPFYLGGYSLGGVLAMELAHQLTREGRGVRFVFLIDAWVPKPFLAGRAKLRHRLSELRRFTWAERGLWVRAQMRRLTGSGFEEEDLLEGAPLIDATLMRELGEQALLWSPPHYPGPVLLFRAQMDLRGYSKPESALGWDACCPRLEVISVPGHHSDIVAEPTVVHIAREIERRIRA